MSLAVFAARSKTRHRVSASADLAFCFRASLASVTQDFGSAVTTSHSFMSRPWPGSKRVPLPAAMSALTRSSGSLTTKCPFDDIMANIFPFTFSARDPNPLPDPGRLTCRSSAKALTTIANRSSHEGAFFGVRVRARGFSFMVMEHTRAIEGTCFGNDVYPRGHMRNNTS
jgi:hypothetical protein